MSNISDIATTSSIVSSILSIYSKNGANIHLCFDHHCISLMQFLHYIVPCIRNIMWPIDKDDVSRVWHSLYLIHDDVRDTALEFALPPPVSGCRTEEVRLHPRFLFETITRRPGRVVPTFPSLHLDDTTGFHVAPMAEDRISTFFSTWFLSSESYVKRVCIYKEACLTTLFVASSVLPHGRTRFNLTWLPHTHLAARVLHRRNSHAWTMEPCDVDRLLKIPALKENEGPELSALVWNVREGASCRLLDNLLLLNQQEKPMLIILTGIGSVGENAAQLAGALGFDIVGVQASEEGRRTGFVVLWDRRFLDVNSRPSYEQTAHLLLKVKDGEKRSVAKRTWKFPSWFTRQVKRL